MNFNLSGITLQELFYDVNLEPLRNYWFVYLHIDIFLLISKLITFETYFHYRWKKIIGFFYITQIFCVYLCNNKWTSIFRILTLQLGVVHKWRHAIKGVGGGLYIKLWRMWYLDLASLWHFCMTRVEGLSKIP